MKVVFNTDQVYLHGGIEKVMATKANYFANIPGVEVFIVTTEQQNKPACYSLDLKIQLIDLGVDYNRSRSYFSKENLKKAVTHFKKQKALFKELEPDVIISPNFNFDHYWLPFIKGKAKLIKERHSSRYYEEEQRKSASFLKRLRFSFNDWIEKRYDHIVVLNSDEKEYVKSGNATVIPNPVEIPVESASLKNKQVLAAGRISPVKAFDELIRAWGYVTKVEPEWELHIYGEDYLNTQSQLERLIEELSLKSQVKFKGSVSDLKNTMLNYSIYAMSSETECFPMVLLESLSVGLPIVSYDCPNGPRNIISEKEDGFLVFERNPEKLAEGLLKLMGNQELREEMGRNAKIHSGRYETSEVMAKWWELLKTD